MCVCVCVCVCVCECKYLANPSAPTGCDLLSY